jgi:hypothetical protein
MIKMQKRFNLNFYLPVTVLKIMKFLRIIKIDKNSVIDVYLKKERVV